jgi:hypothetical protein
MTAPYDPRYDPQQYGPPSGAPDPARQGPYPGSQNPAGQPGYQQQYPGAQPGYPGQQGTQQQYPGPQQQSAGYPGAQPGAYPPGPAPGNQARTTKYDALRKRGERRAIIGGSLLLLGAIVGGIGYATAGEGVVYFAGYIIGFIGLVLLLRGIRGMVNSKLFPATDAAVGSAFRRLRK